MDFVPSSSAATLTLVAILTCLFIMYGYSSYGVFKKLGIPGPEPSMYWGNVTRNNPVCDISRKVVRDYANLPTSAPPDWLVYYEADYEYYKTFGRVWGMYELKKPVLAVMDLEILETILVKKCFSHFTNRRNLRLNGELHDAVSIAEDGKWRRIRNILSPAFTSGRIKEMFGIMKHHSGKLKDILQTKIYSGGDVINVKNLFGPYSIDVMARFVFSVDIDSLNNPSHPYIHHAEQLFNFSVLLFLAQGFFPFLIPLFEMLGISLFPKSSTAFFQSVLQNIRDERNSSSTQAQVDFLQMMLDSQRDNIKRGHKIKGLSDHEILSQATIFVFAGYETTGMALTLLAYNLARNPEVMSRLQEEIDSTFPNKASVEYEALMQMNYLDCVVNESLRLHPPTPRLERVAKSTIEINGITIPKGMLVMIPTYALHRDPVLWPEPEEFKPDRFSQGNKQNIKPFTYLPFGTGPRSCIGLRFALMVIKLALVEVLQNYSFSVCKETEIPLQMSRSGLLGPLRPIKLKMEPRLTHP